jgi:hypothetical protein
MKKKASPKRARAKQKRLSPDDRRKEFVAKATEFSPQVHCLLLSGGRF